MPILIPSVRLFSDCNCQIIGLSVGPFIGYPLDRYLHERISITSLLKNFNNILENILYLHPLGYIGD